MVGHQEFRLLHPGPDYMPHYRTPDLNRDVSLPAPPEEIVLLLKFLACALGMSGPAPR